MDEYSLRLVARKSQLPWCRCCGAVPRRNLSFSFLTPFSFPSNSQTGHSVLVG